LKIKVKFETYVQLHKILTGLNPKAIWELKRDGKNETIDSWLTDEKMPIEFKNWLNKWDNQLDNDYHKILANCLNISYNKPIFTSRKEIAEYFLSEDNREYASILFGLLDKKDVSNIIWKLLEPKFNDVFRADD
jgi:RNA ligase